MLIRRTHPDTYTAHMERSEGWRTRPTAVWVMLAISAMSLRLNAEQRRALAMLATAGRNGATQSLLTAHGFGVSMIATLVNRGLATLTRQQARPAAR